LRGLEKEKIKIKQKKVIKIKKYCTRERSLSSIQNKIQS